MTSFDCLDPKTPLYSHTLLEASAGTGKTFATSHLVTRFVLSGVSLEKILVVTFTIAATKELKERVASCLDSALSALQRQEESGIAYLDEIVSQGERACFSACLLLEQALLSLDKAGICTIHSFCFKCLDEQGMMSLQKEEQRTDYKGFYLEKIKQVLRSHVLNNEIATGSLTRLVRSYQFSFDKLYTALIDHLASSDTPATYLSSTELKKEVEAGLDEIMQEKTLLEALPLFKGLYSAKKALKPSFRKQLSACKAPFTDEKLNTLIVEKQGLFSLLEEQNLKKSAIKDIDETLRRVMRHAGTVTKALDQLRDSRHTFLHLASLCQKALEKDPHTEVHMSPDDLVQKMRRALEDNQIADQLAEKFDVAIIDEFQDTDADQWAIFSTLFIKRRAKAFFLVGDPKQSIYSFRKADISLFYKAKEEMDHLASLDTNYRSSSCLQTLLNRLFSLNTSWLNMPKRSLAYQKVNISPMAEETPFTDGKKALHFCLYKESSRSKKSWPSATFEREVLFPFIAKEAVHLHEREGVSFDKMAVLVKDRFSKNRLASYLAKCGIPYKIGQGSALFDTPAFDFFSLALLAVIEKGAFGSLEALLTHPFALPFEEGACKKHLVRVHKIWETQGFAKAMAMLFHEKVSDQGSIEGALIEQQVTESVAQLQEILSQCYLNFAEQVRSMKGMKHFLLHESHHFLTLEKTCKVPDQSVGVQIMTTFMSKGLEFDVVFPIALLYRHGGKTQFVRDKGKLVPFNQDDEAHHQILEETRSERQRQLYVAMTRAKERLYLPFVMDEHLSHIPLANRSSLETFLPEEGLIEVIDELGASYHYLEEGLEAPHYEQPSEKTHTNTRVIEYDFTAQTKPKYIESFSSLTHGLELSLPGVSVEEHDLPAGKETGVVLHDILEQMIKTGLYQDPYSVKASELIAKRLPEVYYPYKETLEQMVKAVFTKPILSVPLCDIPKKAMEAELSFTFREKGVSMTGFIDLVVIYQGQVFVIDWKSNLLPGYDLPHLEEAIKEHQYDLQARIYKTALLQSMRLHPMNLRFGGAIYIFLRGLAKGEGVIWIEKEGERHG